MCGIIAGFKKTGNIIQGLRAAAHRGPDNSAYLTINKVQLGHTRLIVIDKSSASNQPFKYKKIILSYNGELWNYKQLRERLKSKGRIFKTTGDVEVVAQALDEWGIFALKKFDGMFGLAWWDGSRLRIARDLFGEVPIYYSSSGWAASEIKILRATGARDFNLLPPGTWMDLNTNVLKEFSALKHKINDDPIPLAGTKIKKFLKKGVLKKSISDVPVCCLISGGIDSSLILANLVKKIPNITAYTAVYNPKSNDLIKARVICKHLGVELREVIIPEPTIEGISEVIKHIEIPYKAQVEIAWACLALAKQMRADGFKVTFSGEGADEMFGSYEFSYHAVTAGQDWSAYRMGLFQNQHKKNFLRCNKIFMSQGIECRLPFLHAPLVEYVLSLPLSITELDKKPLKEAARGILPDEILKRPKIAFQDGLGLKETFTSVVKGNPAKFYKNVYDNMYKKRQEGFRL